MREDGLGWLGIGDRLDGFAMSVVRRRRLGQLRVL